MKIELKREDVEGAVRWAELPSEERRGTGQSLAANCPVTRAIQRSLGNPAVSCYDGRAWWGPRWVWLPIQAQRAVMVRPGEWGSVPVGLTFELPLTVREERLWRGR